MNQETFLETLKSQYQEKIKTAVIESEHGGKINETELNKKIHNLLRSATTEGLPRKEFEHLVQALLPDFIFAKVRFLNPNPKKKKRAA